MSKSMNTHILLDAHYKQYVRRPLS